MFDLKRREKHWTPNSPYTRRRNAGRQLIEYIRGQECGQDMRIGNLQPDESIPGSLRLLVSRRFSYVIRLGYMACGHTRLLSAGLVNNNFS